MAPSDCTAGKRGGAVDHAAWPRRARAFGERRRADRGGGRGARLARRETGVAAAPAQARPALGATSGAATRRSGAMRSITACAGLDLGGEIGGVALGRAQPLGERAVAVAERRFAGPRWRARPLSVAVIRVADRSGAWRLSSAFSCVDAPAQDAAGDDRGDEQDGDEHIGDEGDRHGGLMVVRPSFDCSWLAVEGGERRAGAPQRADDLDGDLVVDAADPAFAERSSRRSAAVTRSSGRASNISVSPTSSVITRFSGSRISCSTTSTATSACQISVARWLFPDRVAAELLAHEALRAAVRGSARSSHRAAGSAASRRALPCRACRSTRIAAFAGREIEAKRGLVSIRSTVKLHRRERLEAASASPRTSSTMRLMSCISIVVKGRPSRRARRPPALAAEQQVESRIGEVGLDRDQAGIVPFLGLEHGEHAPAAGSS